MELILIPKEARQFKGLDEKVISLYTRVMVTRKIQGHIEEIYSMKVSAELVSKITDGMYFDCIYVNIINKAVYIAIGVNMSGREVALLGICVGKS